MDDYPYNRPLEEFLELQDDLEKEDYYCPEEDKSLVFSPCPGDGEEEEVVSKEDHVLQTESVGEKRGRSSISDDVVFYPAPEKRIKINEFQVKSEDEDWQEEEEEEEEEEEKERCDSPNLSL